MASFFKFLFYNYLVQVLTVNLLILPLVYRDLKIHLQITRKFSDNRLYAIIAMKEDTKLQIVRICLIIE